jgi:hypothetical protein
MVMLPMDNPVTLLRAWCVFEIYATESSGAVFDIGMYLSINLILYLSINHFYYIIYFIYIYVSINLST